jgi:hypothetical protein
MEMQDYVDAMDAASDRIDDGERYVCEFCTVEVSPDKAFCYSCNEYKGIITMTEWESINGEGWDSE